MGKLICQSRHIIYLYYRAPDKVQIFISIMPISSPNPMFDHLLESSQFGEEITHLESIEVNFTHLEICILYSGFELESIL